MIRQIKAADVPLLKEMECGLEWTYGPDLMQCLVATDEDDKPVMAIGAWSRAEVHMLSCKAGTPGMRFSMLRQLHVEMERYLSTCGVAEVVTWVQPRCSMWRAFSRRLKSLGWVSSARVSWHRKVQHG